MKKLRNKKTGEVVDGYVIVATRSKTDPSVIMHDNTVGSVDKLNEDWEDYEPAEPLINDEKIRKAVRAWAEANGASRAYIVDLGILRDESSGNEIKFNGEPFVGWVTSLKTITELCGEEEDGR